MVRRRWLGSPSHSFRKTAATILDEAASSARLICYGLCADGQDSPLEFPLLLKVNQLPTREDETRRSTAVTAIAVTAVALLIVAALVWSRPGTRPNVREPGPGPVAGTAALSATPHPGGRAPVGRSDARLTTENPAGAARPVRVTMPSTRIVAPLWSVGVARDGQMQIPPNPRVMGWYRYGAMPGERDGGSVVLAGHLDSQRFGLGPLARLRDMRPGDPVELTLSDGTRRAYRVTGL